MRQISALLDLHRSTVSAVIVEWKHLGMHRWYATQNCLSSVAALTTEFQTASGRKVSTITVRQELHDMGFHGRAALQHTMTF
jgi:hypothetical protein